MNECLKLHRLSHACAGKPVLRCFAGLFRHMGQFLFACHIGTNAEIGEGCLFQHNGLGVVISEHAHIGRNVMIYQHVTIGARRGADVPMIEDDVVIGAGALLLGDIVIGRGAKVGAGSVVLNDVPAGATAVGNPARVLFENTESLRGVDGRE